MIDRVDDLIGREEKRRNRCHCVRISLGKGDETQTRKPFIAALRVTESRPAKLGQAAGSESCVVSGDRQDEA